MNLERAFKNNIEKMNDESSPKNPVAKEIYYAIVKGIGKNWMNDHNKQDFMDDEFLVRWHNNEKNPGKLIEVGIYSPVHNGFKWGKNKHPGDYLFKVNVGINLQLGNIIEVKFNDKNKTKIFYSGEDVKIASEALSNYIAESDVNLMDVIGFGGKTNEKNIAKHVTKHLKQEGELAFKLHEIPSGKNYGIRVVKGAVDSAWVNNALLNTDPLYKNPVKAFSQKKNYAALIGAPEDGVGVLIQGPESKFIHYVRNNLMN